MCDFIFLGTFFFFFLIKSSMKFDAEEEDGNLVEEEKKNKINKGFSKSCANPSSFPPLRCFSGFSKYFPEKIHSHFP